MSLALVRKELGEHGWVLTIALAFDALALTAVSAAAADVGRMAAVVRFAAVAGPLNALVVANRLFAREYGGRTQLFLEVLPISRARVFATKWLLGCGFIALTTLAAWWATLSWQRRVEVISLPDALGVLLATFAGSLGYWAFAAMSRRSSATAPGPRSAPISTRWYAPFPRKSASRDFPTTLTAVKTATDKRMPKRR